MNKVNLLTNFIGQKVNALKTPLLSFTKNMVGKVGTTFEWMAAYRPLQSVVTSASDTIEHLLTMTDTVFYTILTRFYLSFVFLMSMLCPNTPRAFQRMLSDLSSLFFPIQIESPVSNDQTLFIFNQSSQLDNYLPFMTLGNKPFKMYSTNRFLEYIPEDFFVQTTSEIEEAITNGYSIVLFHPLGSEPYSYNPSLIETIKKHNLPIQAVSVVGASFWFPTNSSSVHPQDFPITITTREIYTESVEESIEESKEDSVEESKEESTNEQKEETVHYPFSAIAEEWLDIVQTRGILEINVSPRYTHPILLTWLFIWLFPFMTAGQVLAQYLVLRNIRYNQMCFANPETTIFMASILNIFK